MESTEFSNSSYRLPAFFVLTRIYCLVHFLVLSKIKTFCWVNFRAYSFLEVLVRDFSIVIIIEFPKKVFELFIRNLEAPVFEVKSELIWCDISTFLFIKVTKSLPNGFPLKLDFLQNHFEQFFIFYILSNNFC